MKHLRVFVSVLLLAGGVTAASAYDFESGGIYYNITGENTVEVTNNNGDSSSYSGSLEIPVTVSNGDTDYAVTAIGTDALSGNTALESVVIPEGVTTIEEGAFRNCTSLSSLTLPSTLTTIESYAFQSCILGSLDIPEGVTTIGEWAFGDCHIQTLKLPSTLKTIKQGAFYYDQAQISEIIVKAVEPPVIERGKSPFNCGPYSRIKVPAASALAYGQAYGWGGNSRLIYGGETTVDGISYMINGYGVGVSGADSSLKEAIIQPTVEIEGQQFAVTMIFEYSALFHTPAFRDNRNLTKVVIPEGVVNIGDYAFDGCSNLASLRLPNTLTTIGYSAFGDCNGLKSLAIPEGVTTIGTGAFSGCSSLELLTLPSTLTTIPNSAFQNCNSLTSLEIPEGITTIEEETFEYCNISQLKLPSTLKTIKKRAFYTLNSHIKSLSVDAVEPPTLEIDDNGEKPIVISKFWENIKVPAASVSAYLQADGWKDYSDYIYGVITEVDGIRYKIYSTGVGACSADDSLKEAIIKPTVEIEGQQFAVTMILRSGFARNNKLTKVVIPEGVTTIGGAAFRGRTNLESLTLPSTLTTIGDLAFQDCKSLNFLTIPSTVTSIGSNAFDGVSFPMIKVDATTPPALSGSLPMETVIVPFASVKAYKAADYWKDMNIIGGGKNDIEVTTSETVDLTEAIMLQAKVTPASVTTIKVHGPLSSDDVLTTLNTNMRSCYSVDLSDATIDALPDGAFSGKTVLLDIVLPPNLKRIGSNAFKDCIALLSKITITEGVESIGDYAFSGCKNATFSTQLPESLTSIGAFAFQGCNFAEMSLPDGLKTIGNGAFYQCANLTQIMLPDGLTSLGSSAFQGCTALTTADMMNPVELTYVPGSAFDGCTNLRNVYLPFNISSIDSRAFYNCSSLERIDFVAPVVRIAGSAFEGCTSLKSLDLFKCEQFTEIGEAAFSGCTSLKSLNLPASLQTIGSSAFSGCTSMNAISSPALVPPTIADDSTLSGIDMDECILTMPKDKYLDYFRAPYWGQFVEYTASVLVGVEGQGSVMYANNGVVQQSALKAAAMRAPSADADVTAIAYDNANICAKDNSTLTFKIEPAEGYELKSVTYAGEDVTAQVVDGLFTTPIINGDTNINVTFAVSTDYLAMSAAAVSKGAEVEVPVELVNSTEVVGLECNVQIPEGFSVAKNSDGSLKVAQTDRKADQTLTATVDGQVLSIKTLGSQAYTGTEGAVLTIAITPDDAATPADYVLKITDVKFISADGTATRPDAKTTLTLRDYILGDVDSDQMVAINDAVIVMNHIVGADTPAFNAKAADMDGNGSVEINDAVMILNNIVGDASTKSLKKAARVDGLTADELTAASVEIEQGGTALLSLDLTNLDCLTAAQFEIELPEGITAGKASAAERASSHMVKTHLEGNTLKVAMLSMDLDDFEGNEGAILTLPLTADRDMMAGTYPLSLRNVKMSDTRGTLYTLPDTDSQVVVKNWGSVNDACSDALRATGGNGVIVIESPREATVQIVAVDGRTQAVEVAPGKTTVAVSAGVYVVAGQKLIVK